MIFCVEDEKSIRELEIYALKNSGYEAEGFESGAELFAALAARVPELIMLDVMLPGEDGVSLLRRLKNSARTRDIPVIMATARGAEYDKVISLDIGADDYLVKPFGMLEMVSRVRAVLRRASPASGGALMRAGGVEIDTLRHAARAFGAPVELTLKEFELLKTLMSRPGMVFTREMLLDIVWGVSLALETRTVDVHVQTLRQKLGAAGAVIETVRGVGYRVKEDE